VDTRRRKFIAEIHQLLRETSRSSTGARFKAPSHRIKSSTPPLRPAPPPSLRARAFYFIIRDKFPPSYPPSLQQRGIPIQLSIINQRTRSLAGTELSPFSPPPSASNRQPFFEGWLGRDQPEILALPPDVRRTQEEGGKAGRSEYNGITRDNNGLPCAWQLSLRYLLSNNRDKR